nr:MAG TPA: hypothetical protein [Caudoviricetes sp.]
MYPISSSRTTYPNREDVTLYITRDEGYMYNSKRRTECQTYH